MEKYLYKGKEYSEIPKDFINTIITSINNNNFSLLMGAGFNYELNGMNWYKYCEAVIGKIRYNTKINKHKNGQDIKRFLDVLQEEKFDCRYKFSSIKQLIETEKLGEYGISLDNINREIFIRDSPTNFDFRNKETIKELLKLPVKKITTNYDNLLSAELELYNLRYINISNESEYSNPKYDRDTIICIHGYANDGYERMIVDREQYLDKYYLNCNIQLEKLLVINQLDNTKILLVLGYSFSEMEILQYFYKYRDKDDDRRTFAILPFENKYDYKMKSEYFFKNYKIEIIGYNNEEKNYMSFYSFIDEVTKKINENESKNKKLFIEKLIDLPEKQRNQSNILKTLEELINLPPNFSERFFESLNDEKYFKIFLDKKIYDKIDDSLYNIYQLKYLEKIVYNIENQNEEIRKIIMNNIAYIKQPHNSLSGYYIDTICRLILRGINFLTKEDLDKISEIPLIIRELENVLIYYDIEVNINNNDYININNLFEIIVNNNKDSFSISEETYLELVNKLIKFTDINNAINIIKQNIGNIHNEFICYESCIDIFEDPGYEVAWLVNLKNIILQYENFNKYLEELYLLENNYILKTLFFVAFLDEKKWDLLMKIIFNKRNKKNLLKMIRSTLFEYEIEKILEKGKNNSEILNAVEKVFYKDEFDDLYSLQKYYEILNPEKYKELINKTGYKPKLSPRFKSIIKNSIEEDSEVVELFLSEDLYKMLKNFKKYKQIKQIITFKEQTLKSIKKEPLILLDDEFWKAYPIELLQVIFDYIKNIEDLLKIYSKEEIKDILFKTLEIIKNNQKENHFNFNDFFDKIINHINQTEYEYICEELIGIIKKHLDKDSIKFNKILEDNKDIVQAFINTNYYEYMKLIISLFYKTYGNHKTFSEKTISNIIELINNDNYINLNKFLVGYYLFEIEKLNEGFVNKFYLAHDDYIFYEGFLNKNHKYIDLESNIYNNIVKKFKELTKTEELSEKAIEELSYEMAYLYDKNKLNLKIEEIDSDKVIGNMLYYYQKNNKNSNRTIIKFINEIYRKEEIEPEIIKRVLFTVEKCTFAKITVKSFLAIILSSIDKIKIDVDKEYEYDQVLYLALEILLKYSECKEYIDIIISFINSYIDKNIEINYSKKSIIDLVKSIKTLDNNEYIKILVKLKLFNYSYIFDDLFSDLIYT